MDIDQIKTFLEVKRLRNFRLASEHLHVTQAAVSQRIKQLENRLNTTLFNREKNNIYLTPSGEQFAPYAETILAAWQQAKNEIGLHPVNETSFFIAARASIWELFSSSYLNEISKNHPSLVLQTDILNDDVLLKKLLNKSLDIGFFYHLPRMDELESVKLSEFELVLQSHGKKSLEDALNGNYVYVDWGKDLENVHTTQLHFKSRPMMYTNQHIIAQRYVESNDASAFLPYVEGYSHTSTSIVEEAPRLSRQVYAVWHRDNSNKNIIKELTDTLSSIS